MSDIWPAGLKFIDKYNMACRGAMQAAVDQPARISIGTRKAFQRGYQYHYALHEALGVYVCNQESQHAREDEVLVLMRSNDLWVAFDVAIVDSTLHVRQPVFRSKSNVLEPGWHVWQINYASDPNNTEDSSANWQGDNWQVETRI